MFLVPCGLDMVPYHTAQPREKITQASFQDKMAMYSLGVKENIHNMHVHFDGFVFLADPKEMRNCTLLFLLHNMFVYTEPHCIKKDEWIILHDGNHLTH